MLDFIRSKRNSTFIVLALGAIIVVFIFWGSGPGGGSDANAVAVVDGETISVKEYEGVYKRELQYYKDTFKEAFTNDAAKRLNLRYRALDIVINRALAAKAAHDAGIRVTESEVANRVMQMEEFSKGGAFNKELYFRLLKANRIKPKDFEKSIEREIVTSRMQDQVLKDVAVTDDELKAAYMKENRSVNLGYALFDPASVKAEVEVSEKEALEYLRANAGAFMVPVKIKAFYVWAQYDKFVKNVEVTEEEIKEFYEGNLSRFDRPEELKAAHILVIPDPEATDAAAASTAARKKAERILEEIKKGKDFAALARRNSEDTATAKKGGDLGWFQRGMMVSAFEAAAFTLEKGAVSGIVETQFGFHIIKVKDRKEAGVRPIEEVRDSISKMLREEKGREAAGRAMIDLQGRFKEASSLKELKSAAAEVRGVKATASPLVSEDDTGVELVDNEVLRDSAFPLREGDVSRPIRTQDGLYLIKVIERIDAHVPDYPDISDKVIGRLKVEKAAAEAKKRADEFLGKMIEEKPGADKFALAARNEKARTGSTGYFTMTEAFIPVIGAFVGSTPALFELSGDSPIYPEVFVHNGKYYVFIFKGDKKADPSGLDKARDALRRRLLNEKREIVLDEWLTGLRKKAKIKVYEERL